MDPPAGNGTMNVTGLSGKAWAVAEAGSHDKQQLAAMTESKRNMIVSPQVCSYEDEVSTAPEGAVRVSVRKSRP
jgi:hypothetical protein